MTGSKCAVLSSCKTFSSSETSSTPSACAGVAVVLLACAMADDGGCFENTKPNSFVSLSFGTPESFGLKAFDDKFGVTFCEPNEKLNDGEPNDAFVRLEISALEVLVTLAGLVVVAVVAATGVGVAAAPNVPKLNFGAFAKRK